jgi:hypothetical protein
VLLQTLDRVCRRVELDGTGWLLKNRSTLGRFAGRCGVSAKFPVAAFGHLITECMSKLDPGMAG